MKKFVKYGTIAACVLVLGGAGIATAAFALGADPIHIGEFVDEKFNGHNRYYETTDYTVAYTEATVHETWHEAAESPLTSDGTEAFLDSSYDKVTELDIEIVDGYVQMYVEDGISDLRIISDNGNPNNLNYRNMEKYQKLSLRVSEGEQYDIIVPAEWMLDSVEVDATGGSFEGRDIKAKSAEFSTIGGDMVIGQNEGKETSLECINGTINWVGMGEASRSLDVESHGEGEIYLGLPDISDANLIGYDMEYDNGTIDYFGAIREGVGTETKNAKNGMAFLELDAEDGGMIMIQ